MHVWNTCALPKACCNQLAVRAQGVTDITLYELYTLTACKTEGPAPVQESLNVRLMLGMASRHALWMFRKMMYAKSPRQSNEMCDLHELLPVPAFLITKALNSGVVLL